MITLESITEKLGFDPRKGPPTREISDYEDDSVPSPYASLTLEEFIWLEENGYSPVPRKKE